VADVYLDNSSTTRPYPEVIDLVSRLQSEIYGNPSSMHEKGVEAEKQIEEARRQIASFFNNREDEIIFTSGGTEANNLAIKGAALRNRNKGNHLITSMVEHPSVLDCFRYLEENERFKVDYLPVNNKGLVDPDQLKTLVSKNTILVSIMHVNNEIGTIQPLEEIGALIKNLNPTTLLHVDAVQSFSKLPLKFKAWQAESAAALTSCTVPRESAVSGPKRGSCCSR